MQFISLSDISRVQSGAVQVIGTSKLMYIFPALALVGLLVCIGLAGYGGWGLLRGKDWLQNVILFVFGAVGLYVLLSPIFSIKGPFEFSLPSRHWLVRAGEDALVINNNPVYSRALHGAFPGNAPSCMVIPYKDIAEVNFVSEEMPDEIGADRRKSERRGVEYLGIFLREGADAGLDQFLSGLNASRKAAAAQLDDLDVFITPVSNPVPRYLLIQNDREYNPDIDDLYTILQNKGVLTVRDESYDIFLKPGALKVRNQVRNQVLNFSYTPEQIDLNTPEAAGYLAHLVNVGRIGTASFLMGKQDNAGEAGWPMRRSALKKVLMDGKPLDLTSLPQQPVREPGGEVEAVSGQGLSKYAPILLVVLGFVLVLSLVQGTRRIQEAQESNSWPNTEGVITVSEVDVRESTNRVKDGPSETVITKSLSMAYRYSVRGVEYEGSRITFSAGEHDSDADAYVKAHPVGSPVKVYYDPEDPARACLERGFSLGLLSPFLTAASIVVMGVLFYLWRQGKLPLFLQKIFEQKSGLDLP